MHFSVLLQAALQICVFGRLETRLGWNLGWYLKALAISCWCRPLVPSWQPAEMQQSLGLGAAPSLSKCRDHYHPVVCAIQQYTNRRWIWTGSSRVSVNTQEVKFLMLHTLSINDLSFIKLKLTFLEWSCVNLFTLLSPPIILVSAKNHPFSVFGLHWHWCLASKH